MSGRHGQPAARIAGALVTRSGGWLVLWGVRERHLRGTGRPTLCTWTTALPRRGIGPGHRRMGTVLFHGRPYDAPARGKMERLWRTLREQCLQFAGGVTTLHDLNVRILAWVDERYHKAPHGGLMGKTPQAVYESSPRAADEFDENKLRDASTVHARRRVRRDSTLAMDGQDWETDLGFLAGRLVTLGRCLVEPDEPRWIEHEAHRHPLHPVDPVHNSRRRRSVCCKDAAHPARVPFDPPKAVLDRAVGRQPEHADDFGEAP